MPTLVLLEQLNRYRRSLDVAGGACVLRGISNDALVRDVKRRAFNPDDGRFEIDNMDKSHPEE